MKKVLSRINKEQRSSVKKILQVVLGARRPLAVQETAIALGLATSTHLRSLQDARLDPIRLETNICHWCGLFVFINQTRIYLIHQTAKEFLICDSGSTPLLSGWKHCLDPQGIEKVMVRICEEFLSLKDCWPTAQSLVRKFNIDQRIDDFLEKDDHVETFLVYSAEFWPSHLRDAGMPTNDPAMAELSQLYAINSPPYSLWFAIFWKVAYPYEEQPQMNSIRLAALLGHDKLLHLILQSAECYEINESEDDGRTALVWASQLGYDKVVQILLNHGADINAQGGHYGNAVQAASVMGHEKVVQILLDHGADIDAQGEHYGNALQAASVKGHEKVVQILLDHGADINAQGGGYYGNALQAASAEGREKVVQILLDSGVDPDVKDSYGRTALLCAAANGHMAVVKLLIERDDVDQGSQDQYGQIPLLLAAGNGHEAIVKLLIAEDLAGLSSKDNFGRTPLSWASKKGHSNIVQLIREKCHENGIVIRDDDLNIGPPPASDQRRDIQCDICLSHIPNTDIHHHCGICDHGSFDVCQDCLLYGASCLDHSHTLVKRTFDDGVLVELTA